MAKLIVSCPKCSAKYDVGKYDPGTKFKCKKCTKSLIVPDGGEEAPAAPLEPAKPARRGGGGRGGRGGRGGTGRRSRGGTRRRSREDEYDDEYDDRRMPMANKGPNWALIIGVGAAVFLIAVVGIAFMVGKTNKNLDLLEEEEARRREEQAASDAIAVPEPDEDANAKKEPYKPKKIKPKENTGEFTKETYAEDDKRSIDKKATADTKVKRWQLRKKIFDLDASVKDQAENAIKEWYAASAAGADDPPLAETKLDNLEKLGKKAFPAALNKMTKLNHKSEPEAMAGSQLFELIVRMARKHWSYSNEYNYGMFETGEEKWNAIIEMKELWVKHQNE